MEVSAIHSPPQETYSQPEPTDPNVLQPTSQPKLVGLLHPPARYPSQLQDQVPRPLPPGPPLHSMSINVQHPSTRASPHNHIVSLRPSVHPSSSPDPSTQLALNADIDIPFTMTKSHVILLRLRIPGQTPHYLWNCPQLAGQRPGIPSHLLQWPLRSGHVYPYSGTTETSLLCLSLTNLPPPPPFDP
ncbi:hypothetical protein HPB48_012274 [Haemaphysalis longicornis]|uniref:Uncharacterized protein n=1 Tax=Haemaphysalis longicornis TaxID=44386 RepID=A0A9J6GUV4_HAELO|nr:hypothetical protein HPB48_012274 [Haemaphysalis longicornis]